MVWCISIDICYDTVPTKTNKNHRDHEKTVIHAFANDRLLLAQNLPVT